MKIRKDFVTNSSSSSYVIAYKKFPEIDEETLAKYPFLKCHGELIEKILFAEGNNDTTEGVVSRTKEEYDEYFVDYHGWRDQDTVEKILENDKWLVDEYNEAVEWIEKGFNILYKDVDYSDTYCENVIAALAYDTENFVILRSE